MFHNSESIENKPAADYEDQAASLLGPTSSGLGDSNHRAEHPPEQLSERDAEGKRCDGSETDATVVLGSASIAATSSHEEQMHVERGLADDSAGRGVAAGELSSTTSSLTHDSGPLPVTKAKQASDAGAFVIPMDRNAPSPPPHMSERVSGSGPGQADNASAAMEASTSKGATSQPHVSHHSPDLSAEDAADIGAAVPSAPIETVSSHLHISDPKLDAPAEQVGNVSAPLEAESSEAPPSQPHIPDISLESEAEESAVHVNGKEAEVSDKPPWTQPIPHATVSASPSEATPSELPQSQAPGVPLLAAPTVQTSSDVEGIEESSIPANAVQSIKTKEPGNSHLTAEEPSTQQLHPLPALRPQVGLPIKIEEQMSNWTAGIEPLTPDSPLQLPLRQKKQLPIMAEGQESSHGAAADGASQLGTAPLPAPKQQALPHIKGHELTSGHRAAGVLSTPLMQPSMSLPPTPPPLPMPEFSRAEPPQLLQAPMPTSVQLCWPPQQQTGTSGGQGGEDYPPCPLTYCLQLQEVIGEKGKAGREQGGWESGYSGPDCKAEVKCLRPGRQYALRVVLLPEVLSIYRLPPPPPPSETLSIETPPTPPQQPPPPRLAQRKRSSLKFKWLEPHECGGRPILRRRAVAVVTRPAERDGRMGEEEYLPLYDGRESSFKMLGLKPATRVVVKYQVFNEVGESPWSEGVPFTTEASVPDVVPGFAVVDSFTSSVVLQWEEPVNNGEEVTGYRLEVDDSRGGLFDLAWHGNATTHEVGGLVSGRTYRFRVCAFNREGKGLVGQSVEGRTTALPPPSPQQLKVLGAAQTSATLEWVPPDFDGGAAITGWAVELQPKGKAGQIAGMPADWTVVYEGARAACTLKGLSAGCSYRARVTACSSVGWGRPGVPIDVAAAADSPQPPLRLALTTRSSDRLSVTWEAPALDGGSPIVSYRIELNRPPPYVVQKWASVATATEASCEVVDLEPGTEYQLRAFAINALGSSGPSDSFCATTAAAPPGAPGRPASDGPAGGTFLLLQWDCPAEYGAPASGFTLQALRQETEAMPTTGSWQTVYDGKDAAAKVRQLLPATRYGFRVRATSTAGVGEWSETALVDTAAAAPSAPTTVTAAATPREDSPPESNSARSSEGGPAGVTDQAALLLSWQPPVSDNGARVHEYSVQICQLASRGRGDANWRSIFCGDLLSCRAGGLHPGRRYGVRVRATNTRGSSPWSDTVCATTAPGPPSPPPQPTVSQVTAVGLRAKWGAPDCDNGAPVLSYRLEAHDGYSPTPCQLYDGADVTCRVSNLQPGTRYQLRVVALNSRGESRPGEAITVQTSLPPPLPPSCILATPIQGVDGRAIELTWQSRSADDTEPGACFADCASFEAEAAAVVGKPVLRVTCPARLDRCTLPGVVSGMEYKVRLRAVGVGGAGHGPWSAATHVSIQQDLESATSVPRVMLPMTNEVRQTVLSSDKEADSSAPRRRNKKRAVKVAEVVRARPAIGNGVWSVRRFHRELQRELRRNTALVVAVFAAVALAALVALWDPRAIGGRF